MGCPKPGPPFLGCTVGAGSLQPSQTKGLVWTAASALPSGQASQSTSSSGDWGQIKIINNNNRPLGPLQKRIAMATTCWQRCCLRPGGMDSPPPPPPPGAVPDALCTPNVSTGHQRNSPALEKFPQSHHFRCPKGTRGCPHPPAHAQDHVTG